MIRHSEKTIMALRKREKKRPPRSGRGRGACLANGRTTFDDSFIAKPVAPDSERGVEMSVDLLLI